MAKCIFCRKEAEVNAPIQDAGNLYGLRCELCGEYCYNQSAFEFLGQEKSITLNMSHCIHANVIAADDNQKVFWSTKKEKPNVDFLKNHQVFNINDYKSIPVLHSTKVDKIMALVAKKIRVDDPFGDFGFDEKDMYRLNIYSVNEFSKWLQTLIDSGYFSNRDLTNENKQVANKNMKISFLSEGFSITPSGWQEIERYSKSLNSREVFIALSFRSKQRSEIQSAIEDALGKTNWNGFSIDQREYLGGITDEILASINKSAFVIADFTENKAGVYFEAGYAMGQNKHVILTCHEDYIAGQSKEGKELHFDTKHYNYITWATPEDLKEKLIKRIEAVLGVG